MFLGVVAGAIITFSGLAVEPAGMILVHSTQFSYQTESLFGNESFLTYRFGGSTFTFHLWCAISPAGGIVCGNVTEPDGERYAYQFSDGPTVVGPAPWQTWIAPNGLVGVQYQQGGTARLLVREV